MGKQVFTQPGGDNSCTLCIIAINMFWKRKQVQSSLHLSVTALFLCHVPLLFKDVTDSQRQRNSHSVQNNPLVFYSFLQCCAPDRTLAVTKVTARFCFLSKMLRKRKRLCACAACAHSSMRVRT